MAVSEKQNKIRLYKVAKDFNISHDTLIDFLSKKGFDVKNHMSIVDDEMLEVVSKHYKKDKAEAERHARKRREFDEQDRKRRGEDEKPESEEQPAPPADTVVQPPAAEVEPVAAPSAELPVEAETAAVETEPVVMEQETTPAAEVVETVHAEAPAAVVVETPPVAEMPEVVPAPPVAETAPVAEATPPADTTAPVETVPEAVETPADETAPVAEETAATEVAADVPEEPVVVKKPELDVSIQASVPKMGLKVRGMIDLKALAETKARGEKSKDAAGKEGDDDKPKHKKKLKKKIVAGAPAPTEETTDADKKKVVAKKVVGKRGKAKEVDAEEVAGAIKRTIAAMGDYGASSARASVRKKKRARREENVRREVERAETENRVLKIYEYATVSEIAGLMNVSVPEIISSLIGLGVMASINQRLDLDTITLVSSEFGFEVQTVELTETDLTEDLVDEEETLVTRPPIVTIMGHVDHGKTSLLDYIRKTNVVAGESGGITQHIGAYTVELDSGRRITFLDTPGHEAFTAMRARGAQATDIVVLVVAADDSVMPQTLEAISHALAAKVPIIVAINKIDKPNANIDRIKQQLSERNVLIEEWGGKYGAIPISAKQGTNIDMLLERITLEADILDLKANEDRLARGVVIESKLDKKGIVATVLVQKGTLRVGDAFVAGNEYGRVRSLMDERDKKVQIATPATPVQVLGFNGMPQAGDLFVAVESDREARLIASERQQIKRESEFRSQRRQTLDDISAQIKLGGVEELSLVVKGDVDGSVEALSDSLQRLSTDEVRVRVILANVGAISESDVLLASASNAIIIGFHVRPNLNARKLAEAENVDIRLYEIIYDAIDDVKKALEGLLSPEVSERILATVLVRETFKISRLGTIAGCYVQDGKITRNNRVRLVRDGMTMFNGSISSLKRFKEDVREVDTNFECGISLDGFNDIKVGDIIEAYERVETKRTLA
ncbi:MAG: translation initiation factor IF-2 [Ignavibacteriae bacterium]|nr:translation initiation factor IF-2 [Ignavibacteriota bacterium]